MATTDHAQGSPRTYQLLVAKAKAWRCLPKTGTVDPVLVSNLPGKLTSSYNPSPFRVRSSRCTMNTAIITNKLWPSTTTTSQLVPSLSKRSMYACCTKLQGCILILVMFVPLQLCKLTCKPPMNLESLLITPVQRIPRYNLLLQVKTIISVFFCLSTLMFFSMVNRILLGIRNEDILTTTIYARRSL